MINAEPYFRTNKGISYIISPKDKETIEKFNTVVNRLNNIEKRLKNKQKNKFSEYKTSEVRLEEISNISQRDLLEIYQLSSQEWISIYTDFLFGDSSTLSDSFKQYYGTNKVGENHISFESIDRTSPEDIILTINEDEFKFKINKVSYREENILFDELERFGVTNVESEVAEGLNSLINSEQYGKWNFNGSSDKVEKQEKSKKTFTELTEYYERNSSKEDFCRYISGDYLTSYEAHRLYYFLINKKDRILFNYGCLNPEIIDVVVEKYNVNYVNIPQIGMIILFRGKDPFSKEHFESKIDKQTDLTHEEQKKILEKLGVSEECIKQMKKNKPFFTLKEIEKVCKMYRENRLTDKELKSYLWSPYYSDTTEDGVYEIVQEGRNRKKNNPNIVNDDNLKYSNKKYFYPLQIEF